MNVEQLKQTATAIEEQYNNLSNPEWVSLQRQQLKGKYDILQEVIAKAEVEEASKKSEKPNASSKSTQ